MKNGIAMISNFSMPVNSFSATDSIGTVVIVNRNVSTVRPSEIEIGMPVSISPISSAKMIHALARSTPASLSATGMPMMSDRQQRRPARRVERDGRGEGAHFGLPPAAGAGCRLSARRRSMSTTSMPSTCATSWCGSSPVRAKYHATCRKRKHIRYEPSGMHR